MSNNTTTAQQSGPSDARLVKARYDLNAAVLAWRSDISNLPKARAVDDAVEELEAAAIANARQLQAAGGEGDLAVRIESLLTKLRERGNRTKDQHFTGNADLLLANELEGALILSGARGEVMFQKNSNFTIAHTPPAGGFVVVRKEAIDWLNGESDFECPPEMYFRGEPPRYWWRSVFRQKAGLDDAAPAAQVSPLSGGVVDGGIDWPTAMALADKAVNGEDGRGMIGDARRHLTERVAAALQSVWRGQKGEVVWECNACKHVKTVPDGQASCPKCGTYVGTMKAQPPAGTVGGV